MANQLNEEVFFFAYHLHWEEEQTLKIIPYRRRKLIERFIEQRERENEEHEKALKKK